MPYQLLVSVGFGRYIFCFQLLKDKIVLRNPSLAFMGNSLPKAAFIFLLEMIKFSFPTQQGLALANPVYFSGHILLMIWKDGMVEEWKKWIGGRMDRWNYGKMEFCHSRVSL